MQNYENLFDLERELLLPETRKNVPRLNELLDASFFEFGSSGKVWSRNAILESLPLESTIAPAITTTTAEDFTAHEMGDGLVLVTYRTARHSGGKIVRALRSSIWRRTQTDSESDSGWKMTFHQGTPTSI